MKKTKEDKVIKESQTVVRENVEADKNGLRVRRTVKFRLHDVDRPYVAVVFKRDFGFVPDAIIIEKVPEVSNTCVVMAVLTKEEAEKEDALLAEREQMALKATKKLKILKKLENKQKKEVK